MKKMSFNIIILIGLLSAGNVFCADSNSKKMPTARNTKRPTVPINPSFNLDRAEKRFNEYKSTAEPYIKEYHGMPYNLANELQMGFRDQQMMPNKLKNEYSRYMKDNKRYIDNAMQGVAGSREYSPDEYIKEGYKDNADFQQSVANARAYRATLSPELQKTIPELPADYGTGPRKIVKLYTTGSSGYGARDNGSEQMLTQNFGPADRRGTVRRLDDIGKDPNNPQSKTNMHLSLKREDYRKLMNGTTKPVSEPRLEGSELKPSDIVSRTAAVKPYMQKLLGRPIKTEADAAAAVKLMEGNRATQNIKPIPDEQRQMYPNSGKDNRSQPNHHILQHPSVKNLFIKALPGVAQNQYLKGYTNAQQA